MIFDNVDIRTAQNRSPRDRLDQVVRDAVDPLTGISAVTGKLLNIARFDGGGNFVEDSTRDSPQQRN